MSKFREVESVVGKKVKEEPQKTKPAKENMKTHTQMPKIKSAAKVVPRPGSEQKQKKPPVPKATELQKLVA